MYIFQEAKYDIVLFCIVKVGILHIQNKYRNTLAWFLRK